MYEHLELEKKWQKFWQEQGLDKTPDDSNKPKYYVLDMFPYPSGQGLHVGHPKGYIATDIITRYKRLQGFNVLHPMGWDAFGLPAENYALQNKIHPRKATEENVANFKRQISLLGLSYDWDREINTTDPKYYHWTQWIFLQMWKKGLAYESFAPINWCPSCKTGLANEDLENGHCERCGSLVEQKPMRQWVLKITDYAERLLSGLDDLPGWEEPIKEMQRNWIGRSEGANIRFSLAGGDKEIEVFTTRLDTIFGCTYLVLAPEHPLVKELYEEIENQKEVDEYLEKVEHKSELERTDLNKDKTGVALKGFSVINPFTGEELPLFIADYVLASYGSGAVMAVPAHDERDWEFAHKYKLPIKISVSQSKEVPENLELYTEEGYLVNSGEYSGLSSQAAREKMMSWLEKENKGGKQVNYKLKDWVYSRQRYWGEPIPLIHCDKCGVVGVPEKELPLELPEVESYEPSGTGESPLANIDDWVNTTCPSCGGPAKRETNTMPQWGGSCWYYLRYLDPHNDKELCAKDKDKYWSPVDLYVGGAEHATRHLIYARFWHKFLYDIGVVNYQEPFSRLQHVGLIMGEDGRKMSKRWGNVVNPDDMVERFGADALRIYEMFMGPFDQAAAWSTNGLSGAKKFLDKLELLFNNSDYSLEPDKKLLSLLHKTVAKVGDDLENFRFNTSVSALMILVNAWQEAEKKINKKPLTKESYAMLLQILSPFAPHLAEELWRKLGNNTSIFLSSWPQADAKLAKDENNRYIVQVNGKLRAQFELPAGTPKEEVLVEARKQAEKWLEGKSPKKEIFVPEKLVNFVV